MKKSESLCLKCKHYDPADDVIIKTMFDNEHNIAPSGGLCMFRNIPRPLPVIMTTNSKKEKEFIPEVLECNKFEDKNKEVKEDDTGNSPPNVDFYS